MSNDERRILIAGGGLPPIPSAPGNLLRTSMIASQRRAEGMALPD